MIAPFYLIVDNADVLQDYLPTGVKCVQLRMKNQSAPTVRDNIRIAKTLCEEHACQLIVNDYWQLALDEGCNYIHLGQEDLMDADIGSIKKAHIRIGISSHDRAELNRALAAEPDHIALGPIYATLLKKMPWRPQGLEKLQRWKDSIGDIPLVAIGGFTPERARGAFDHGADSVCVVTDVQQHANPVARIQEWLDVTSSAGIRSGTTDKG